MTHPDINNAAYIVVNLLFLFSDYFMSLSSFSLSDSESVESLMNLSWYSPIFYSCYKYLYLSSSETFDSLSLF